MNLLKTKREALLEPLQAVAGIIERRHTLPILSNVLLSRTDTHIDFVATDIEIEITTSMAVDGPGEAKRITVVFNVTGKDASRQVVGQGKDLSEKGLLLVAPAPITIGAVLQIEFFLPGTRSQIKARGKVVRSAKGDEGVHEVGVQFIDLSPDDRALILDYVTS